MKKLEVELLELINEELRFEMSLYKLALVGMTIFTALSYVFWMWESLKCTP